MAYGVRFKSRAKEELDEACACYGETFRTDLWSWLNRIAEGVESGDDSVALDIGSVLEEGLCEGGKSWKHSWRKWWSESMVTKIRAAYTVVRKWCPPWELKLAVQWFPVIGQLECEIHAYFIIDHVEKRIIIVKFEGLPGQ